MNKKQSTNRKIIIEFSVDWNDYEDVSDELIVEDMGILEGLKEGVKYRIVKDQANTDET